MASHDVHAVLAAHGIGCEAVVRLGEGQDNVAYEVDGELIVRFAKGGTDVLREAKLLETVARFSPFAVPTPVFVEPECMAYRKLPGIPLVDVTPPPGIAKVLNAYVDTVQAIPVDAVAGLVDTDDDPVSQWLAEAHESYAAVEVPREYRRSIERFLDAEPPTRTEPSVFSHNDLGIEHVLVDPATGDVTGIIDWTDAALCDPAYDHGLIYRDLGVLIDGPLAARAAFYARCTVLEDLAYGITSGIQRYADEARRSLRHLFEPQR
ncbi:Predicted kinase, aminoglycoside phosphotransferase (APT) family [Actinokineospora alba]|uniref:Predicted kinase, aminoglycoside phosphotransferase (APT) family n=1 Tax=Actinokineospora alba TaxID=504798 RepID=A0A1H0TXU4_9PSEU|nr:phosphotransferase [Actinokineospora alba]TDP70773.1 aminoglycoside phosphotransferase (APT) family kinase protein [Actinokineospora alba]SDJ16035.1 Predicted kinase, aminoglycoside phosphotransferase (APT) family [Actinokineospora alba]SDP58600.1 Predicted kinase, aminoglycoside phosphotransferase (APT) family [Actinokineospora alba]